MIALPAIDVSRGEVVQWVGGRPAHERVRLPDPRATARTLRGAGFAWLHVVDLDAALGRGSNRVTIGALLREAGTPPPHAGTPRRANPGARETSVQVGGGVRSEARAAELVARGAQRVVVGTRAVRGPRWLAALAAALPGRIVVAADLRGRRVVTDGWTRDGGVDVASFLDRLGPLPLAAVLVTDVDREGSLRGADVDRFRDLVRQAPHPLLASGGIRDLDDVRRLRDAGVAGAVVGMALYTGGIDLEALAREFGADDGGLGPRNARESPRIAEVRPRRRP